MKMFQKILLLITTFALLLCEAGFVQAKDAASQPAETKAVNTAGEVSVKTVETTNFSMEYCRFGTGERTLVILPGLSIQNIMDSAEAIAQAYQPLTEAFTIYVFERRQDLPSSYSLSDMTRDTAEAFEALGLHHISIFGASYGGMTAMEMAIRYPDLVDKIILASATAELTEEEYQTVGTWIRLAETGDAEKLYLAFGEALYPEEVYEQSRELLTAAAKTVTEKDLERFIILAKGMKGFTVAQDLDQIQCPVLIIADKQDQVLGYRASEKIAESMKDQANCEFYLYDGYGHAVYDLAPDFKERMLQFLMQ